VQSTLDLGAGNAEDEGDRSMQLIHHALEFDFAGKLSIRIPVDRMTLAKRRWRGAAEDGTDFGFDLEKPLADGAAVFASEAGIYIIAQKYEPVLEVALGSDAPTAARLGWLIGNLHFPLEVAGATVRVADDSALRQLFERERIPFIACKRVFHPLAGGHHH
jgi:urease accessory protein